MPVMTFLQARLFDPAAMVGILEAGTLPWAIHELRGLLVPKFLQDEWRGAGTGGRKAWPAPVLMAIALLRWSEQGGMSRLAACRRARTDLAWRAAMGLTADASAPSEKTMREFEAWLRGSSPACDRPRVELIHEGLLGLAVGDVQPSNWMMDGTPMFCFGALRGTVRLLGEGVRGLLQRLARAEKTSVGRLADQLDVSWVTAKSIKSGLVKDWRDADKRRDGVHRLVEGTQRVIDAVLQRLPNLPLHRRAPLQRRCETLLKVILDDLDTDETGRFFIARRSAPDRTVSITDPEARSGRKTKSQPFKGFILNMLGDLELGVIAAVKVIPGNAAEGAVAAELVERARRLGQKVQRVLADSAYGGTPVQTEVGALGADLVAPPPPVPTKPAKVVQKHLFEVDFEAKTATCPAQVETSSWRMVGSGSTERMRFEWPRETCLTCPLRERCAPRVKPSTTTRGRPPTKGRVLVLHPSEEALRAHRKAWKDPEVRAAYRRRTEGERLIHKLVHHGGRQARAFGLAAANLQAQLIAMVVNLGVYGRRLASERAPPPTPQAPLFG